ncbi:DUF4352 domain-containing protein [Lysinibacillus fusiformis]|nr:MULTISPECIES: DUF4352 domain-containing protein [Lysinibacillus]MED4670700.1 DUF4352 domain-containing protein [Lysinibacillus fusiformis]QAS56925.1 DUF4352 domain-containing protein [Lysinibacillus sphaericus]RDV32445.1 DUF4352 domain-containing protein [Lysinibacillus fusiformis]SCX51849.1 protein of unknown function [Lysinibacillus fusiformis]SDB27987.1 protein of unknown function [Lysinibacillus fusiformis]
MKRTFIYLFMFCLFLAGCGSNPTSNSLANETSKDKIDEKIEEESKEEQKNEEFELKQIGETFKLEDWEVTLESFEFNKTIIRESVSTEANEGNKFLILNFNVINNGTEADQLMKPRDGASIKAVFNDKYDYEISLTLMDGDLHHENVRPLSTAKGFVAIEMPDNVVEASESISIFMEKEEDKVQINIR